MAPFLGESASSSPQLIPEPDKLHAVRERIASRYAETESDIPAQLYTDLQFLLGLVDGLREALERKDR